MYHMYDTLSLHDDPSKQKLRRGYQQIVISLLLVVLIGFSSRFAMQWALLSSQAVHREMGYPATADDLERWYPPATQWSVIEPFVSLHEKIEQPPEAEPSEYELHAQWGKMPFGSRAPEALLARLREGTKLNASVKAELTAVLGRTESITLPLTYARAKAGVGTSMPLLRQLADLYIDEAIVLHAQGQIDEAVVNLQHALRTADLTKPSLGPSAQLTRAGIISQVHQLLEQILYGQPCSPALLKPIMAHCAAENPLRTMPDEIAVIYCQQSFVSGPTYMEQVSDDNLSAPLAIYRSSRIGVPDQISAYRSSRRLIAYAKSLIDQPHRWPEPVAEPRFAWISKLLWSNIHSMTKAGVSRLARLRTVIVGLAVKQYVMAEGRFPSGLNELAPTYLDTVVIDPFDGKPIRYRIVDDHALVYTVGFDLNDDAGRSYRQANEINETKAITEPLVTYDRTFRVK